MRKSFFLVIALVLLVSGAAYAATITATLTVEIPSYIYLSFSNAEAEQIGSDTTTIDGAAWTVPAGGPGEPNQYVESGQYNLRVLSTAQWDLAISGPTTLSSTTSGSTNEVRLHWKYGNTLPSTFTEFPDTSVTAFTELNNAATGSTAFARLVQFAVPYTWDVVADTYAGDVIFTATAH